MKTASCKRDKWQVTGDKRLRVSHSASRHLSAFTLIEMLVVIAVLGILAGLAVPALKNISKGDANTSAARQMLDDVGRARQMAISRHTTVYMVFVPTNFFNLNNVLGQNIIAGLNNAANIPLAADRLAALTAVTNLVEKQLTGYAFIALGTVGDQPGKHNWNYINTTPPLQKLPEGTYIAAQKFAPSLSPFALPQWQIEYSSQPIPCFNNFPVPFPTAGAPAVFMPYIAFDYTGRLISEVDAFGNYHNADIPLVQGTVGYGYNAATKTPLPITVPAGAITETPPGNSGITNNNYSYNVIHVDALTGRAVLQYHKLP